MALISNGLIRTGTARNDIEFTASVLAYNKSYNILNRTGTGRSDIAWTNINTGSDTSGVTATAADVLDGKYYVNSSGTRVEGTMTNQGTKKASLNCGKSYIIPKGYHNGSGKVTANSLSSQTSATATASRIRSGYTAWVNGTKITGTMAVQSALSFSATATSSSTIRIQWKNPAKGPYNGVNIRRSTSGYPGSSGGTSVYTGTGSSKTANATSYKDITGLSANTTYYFTCTSVASPLPNGSSYNVSAKTKEVEIQTFLQSFINNGCCQVAGFNCRNYNYLTAVKIAWSGHNNYQSQFTSSGNNIYIDADGWDNSTFRFRNLSSFWGTNYSSENSGLYIKVNNTASTTVEASVTTLCNNIRNNFNYVSIRGTGYDENPNTAESYGDIKISGVESFGIQNTGRITTVSWTTSGKYIRTSDMVGQWIVIGFDIGYSHGTDGYLNNIQNGLFVFKKK